MFSRITNVEMWQPYFFHMYDFSWWWGGFDLMILGGSLAVAVVVIFYLMKLSIAEVIKH